MKKLIALLFIIPLISFDTIQEPSDFLGRWTGEDKGNIGFINFDKEGYASFEIQGQVIGGKEFLLEGKKGSMTYKVNMDTDPIEIDFTITKLETKEQKSLLAIVKFEDNNNMRIAIDFNAARPTDFDGENAMTLKRVE